MNKISSRTGVFHECNALSGYEMVSDRELLKQALLIIIELDEIIDLLDANKAEASAQQQADQNSTY